MTDFKLYKAMQFENHNATLQSDLNSLAQRSRATWQMI